MIGSEDDQSVLENLLRRERLLEPPYSFVDVRNFGIVAAVRVWLVGIIQMDEGEEGTPGFSP